MQHLLCQLTQRFLIKFSVKLYDFFVLMAGTQLHSTVSAVKPFYSFFPQLVAFLQRTLGLPSASDTSARAGHHFYEMVFLAALFYSFNEF